MKLAAVQLAPTGNRSETIDRAAELVDEAATRGAEVIVLPELFAVPFVQPEPDMDYFELAEPLDGPSNAMARERSARNSNVVVSSVFEAAETPGVYHNTACTFVRGELESVYRKSHLPFSNGFPEKFYFRPGDAPPEVVHTDGVNIGTIICYERHFPELGRAAALAGAQVLCVPVASASHPMRDVFQLELRAHAVFNGLFVACANRIGLEGEKDYFGLSAIYDPNGEVIAQADDEGEGAAIADIDVTLVEAVRQRRPFLRDRRPGLYGSLTQTTPER